MLKVVNAGNAYTYRRLLQILDKKGIQPQVDNPERFFVRADINPEVEEEIRSEGCTISTGIQFDLEKNSA